MPSRIAWESKALAVIGVSLPKRNSTNVMRRACGRVNCYVGSDGKKSAFVGAFARRDLLDQFDDRATHFGVRDARERARQRQAFGGGKEIRDIGGRGGFA